MGGWATVVADLLFPRDCPCCHQPLPIGDAHALCAACRASLVMPTRSLCLRCGIPTVPSLATCPACAARPPAFHTARALGLYLADGGSLNPLAAAVRALKYRGERSVARTLGRMLAERYLFDDDALVVPVPLHRRRLRQRGFNQAVLLARSLAATRSLPLALRALERRRDTPSQAGLDAPTRRRNLRRAFVARGGVVDGRPVVLVDDVLTTGATANACAVALRRAGATAVAVYTVGRTP